MHVIAIANQKWGVGKTTLTRELAACCAIRGYQTLIIDCDPQKNQTTSWLDMDAYEATLSHVLIEPETDKFGKRAKLPPQMLSFDLTIKLLFRNLSYINRIIRT